MGGNMTAKEFILGVADGELSKKDILDYAKEYFTTCSELDSLLIKMTAQTMNEPEIVFTGDRDGDGLEEIKDISRVPIVEKKQEDRLFEAMGIIEAYKENLEIPHREQATTDAQSLNPEPQQEQQRIEQTASTILTINDTDKEKLVFGNALQKQYMSLDNGSYKWTLSKSLLAYLCGRLYCGDKIKEDESDYRTEYIKGRTQMPAQEVKALFGVDVASNRYSIKTPPRNSWKVDELFKSNGASK